MADERHSMKRAMTGLTLTTFVFLAGGAILPWILLWATKRADFSFLCFVVVGVAICSVRYVLIIVDRRLTLLEQAVIDRRAAEQEKERAD
jgi:hypothetical protein